MVLQEALRHTWLIGETATDYDVLPEIKSYIAKARLRRGIEMVKLANRIEALKMRADDPEEDLPADTGKTATEGVSSAGQTPSTSGGSARRLSRAARSAIFREVVLAKVRELKEEEAKQMAERTLTERSKK